MVDILKCNTDELKALMTYKEVVENNERFPHNFWTNECYQTSGVKIKSRILTRYCLGNLAKLTVSNLPNYNLKEIKSVLVQGKLSGMLQIIFNCNVLEALKNAYPLEFKKRVLKEWMWSTHGVWNNDAYIIEAVKDMVKNEGIHRVVDIPTLDWKQRLLDYGIYNVLSCFNWSIYKLFNFVYPNKFHPVDFKYKIKWATESSLDNAFYFMHKVFKEKKYSVEDIVMLNLATFKRIGLAAMLTAVFDGSIIKAKEYYLYKTIGDKDNLCELQCDIKRVAKERYDANIIRRLNKVAVEKYIYTLNIDSSLYNFLKRHSRQHHMSIGEFIASYGFKYRTAKNDVPCIDPNDIWDLRKQRYSYVQIAEILNSNPTTISEMCCKHFGGDPLIPRPMDNYITVQELMNKYRVDHKTVMKLVNENGFENHMTIRFRYLNKLEIEPALKKYIKQNKWHQIMVARYS